MTRQILISLLAIFLVASGSAARAHHITPALVPESVKPASGKTTTLAIAMYPEAGWHGYWKNPGDAGVETVATWTAPKGVRFEALQYPVPKPLLIAGMMNHVYEADYAELVTVDVPRGLRTGTRLPISVKLDWLACNPSTCVPESATLTTVLTAGDGTIDAARVEDFRRWRAALPQTVSGSSRFEIENGRLRLELPAFKSLDLGDAHFFALTDKAIDYAARQSITRDGDRLVIETAAKPDASPGALEGILRAGNGQGWAFKAMPGHVATAAKVSLTSDLKQSKDGIVGTMLLSLGAAILGGLLLNVMPCVFPVLSIKALSLARSGGSEMQARREALAYTAGVILVCSGLGAVLLSLRSAGQLAGWAFQLQDVRMIIALLLLVIVIAFNFAGLFELPVISGGSELAAKDGTAGSFWTGALAAFVATPCSGPFMGTALGVALLLPAWGAIVIFAGLGFGLALPFLALGFIPALRSRLPKPGHWTDKLRRALSLPMFLTALGLAWVAGRQAGVNAMTLAMGAVLVIGLGLWRVGRRQSRLNRYVWWPLAPCTILIGLIFAAIPHPSAADGATAAQSGDGEERFDEKRLAALRAEGRPVLLYFTADWCLTCKVNEKVAIERSEVRDAFAARKVVVMVGDWTNGDPAISRFLNEHGRSGVPFYLFYPKTGGPRELPQVLTPKLLSGLA